MSDLYLHNDHVKYYSYHLFVAKVVHAKSEVKGIIDDDDIITVDKNEVEINGEGNANIEIISSAIINKIGRKRKLCLGLYSDLIAKYVNRIPVCHGGAHHVEVIAKEMYPKKFSNKFTRKKLKPFQKVLIKIINIIIYIFVIFID
ncbi:hypothetical protein C1646_762185 [Rhizophagus diaphanus]|nr:hypothetical protein C1646_762185 [Rhizophagus diaphanus] [Rhizophagus sp. MUCL 43196]